MRWRHLVPHVGADAGYSLAAAWPLDEGSGYSFGDVSGNGHPLYITGDDWNTTDSGLLRAFARQGRRAGGVYLNGRRRLVAQDQRWTTGLAVAVSLWVRPDAFPRHAPTTLIGFGTQLSVQVTNSGGLDVSMSATGRSASLSVSPVCTVGCWTHVVVTADLDQGGLRVWVDGVLQQPHTGHTSRIGRSTAAGSLGGDVVIGEGLVGTVDEICVHSAVLDATTVRRLYIVGLPKVYTQTQESRDADRTVPDGFKGSEPVPHPIETDSVFNARFALTAASEQGLQPVDGCSPEYLPGLFGGALRAVHASDSVTYASPLTGDSGTFEAWHRVVADPCDHRRSRRKVLFEAAGSAGRLTVLTECGRWRVEFGTPRHPTRTVLSGPEQTFAEDVLEHVAVAWGLQPDNSQAVVLFVGGVEVGRAAVPSGTSTTYDSRIVIGGGRCPAWLLVEDVRITSRALGWGQVCPSGICQVK